MKKGGIRRYWHEKERIFQSRMEGAQVQEACAPWCVILKWIGNKQLRVVTISELFCNGLVTCSDLLLSLVSHSEMDRSQAVASCYL
ncbi:hypothetical protein ACM26V_20360 [Salipaludibacillus sp. HK11]|uniref:hypothetical protein n=1 Tax=Salipaludibacillus sp. HK11 TaxID=3394320 RepID=UPI0039FBE25D